MARSRGDMASLTHLALLVALSCFVLCRAGPLGPLPNVTSADLGFKEGSCALGDVVYMPGDEFPGTSPCERCVCAGGGVRCEPLTCEPRPGCKAVHRPDHCCPTYQCECEQEGRVYGNGEKLVDPLDPCRVCYCQGGEVVCRRIACFVRDDCTPRLVPGRCCPEYDNCPLRGVTSLPGVSTSMPSVTAAEIEAAPPKENIKQEITIKEITPVSEIPVITEVKIKEILPVPTDVAEYSSSKSPLIPREATTEKGMKELDTKTESPSVIELHSSQSTPVAAIEPQSTVTKTKETDSSPSKISLSTKDPFHSAVYPSSVPIVATMGLPPVTAPPTPAATTKAPMMEEEDTFDHDPAFPPLPDDLAVLRNHEDEIVPEVVGDGDHLPGHDIMTSSINPPTETPSLPDVKQQKVTAPEVKELLITTTNNLPYTTIITTTEKEKTKDDSSTYQIETTTTEAPNVKENPKPELRSAIPTEIVDSSSLVPDDVSSANVEITTVIADVTTTTNETPKIIQDKTTTKTLDDVTSQIKYTNTDSPVTTTTVYAYTTSTERQYSTPKPVETTTFSEKEQELTTTMTSKSNVATEITLQTEISSLPVETSDQNPPEVPEYTTNSKVVPSTTDSLETTKIPLTSAEVITVSRGLDTTTNFNNVETTEFIVPSYGSSETATDAVELIKISAEPEKSASIIKPPQDKKNTVMTDFRDLVNDVASISDHIEQKTDQLATTTSRISNSEELIPVNVAYNKNKNKNSNQNSITEIPLKIKNKQKVVEIEDDESESVTDSLPPNDKVEPTTRRPIIDNVSDNMAANKTDKNDIEIIKQSYVPTISRRPSKVVKKSGERHLSEESATSINVGDDITVIDASTTARDTPSTIAPPKITPSTTPQASTETIIPSTAATESSTIIPSTTSPSTTAPSTMAPSTTALLITPFTTDSPPSSSTPRSTMAPSTMVPTTVAPQSTITSAPITSAPLNTAPSTETPPTTQ